MTTTRHCTVIFADGRPPYLRDLATDGLSTKNQ
jgi:hypothetical protein